MLLCNIWGCNIETLLWNVGK